MGTNKSQSGGSENAENFDLTWHLPHLLRRAHFEAEARFSEFYGTQATSRQLALLVVVAKHPGATQSEVGEQIGLDANTCSDLVRRTVARGWLRKEQSASDGRARLLRCTAKGQALVREVAMPLATTYSDFVARQLSSGERQELAKLLRKLLGLRA